MNVAWVRTVEPTIEPLALADVKTHCKVSALITDDDAYLTSLITVARAAAEEHCSRGLLTQTWKLVQDDWAGAIWLPRAAPLQAVGSVKYLDAALVQQTVDPAIYLTDAVNEPARVVLQFNQFWPTLLARAGAVEILYTVGWTSAALVPAPIKHGMLLLIGHLYKSREVVNVGNITSTLPWTVDALWEAYRVWWRPPAAAA